jgi:lipopolysaccharide export system protein LptC
MTYKYTAISLMMILIVGLATWTTFLSYRPQNNTSPNSKQLPDAFMEDITAFIMDKQGNLNMKIVTPKMVHFTENDTTMLSSPQLTLYRNSPNPWLVTANYAKATEGIENVHFWDNVVIHHDADENNPTTLIKTSTLMVHPNKQTAETNQLVTMIQPSLVVKAIGMQADMNSGDIKLLSHAKGEYVPNEQN